MHPSLFDVLDQLGLCYKYVPTLKRPELLQIVAPYEGLIIRSKTYINAEFLDKATSLRFIARAGAGLDSIDLEETKKRNIRVFAANEGNCDAVAEHTVGALLTLLNKIHTADKEVRAGVWQREANRGAELMGKTVAIIGYGHNGQATAQRLSGFGVQVLAVDTEKKGFTNAFVQESNWEEIFEKTDILSLHVPLSNDTNCLINSSFIDKFKKNFYLLNNARGELVVLADLLNALQNGKILGACLDVLENEKFNTLTPSQKHTYDRLFTLPNVVLTPHVAGWTHESYRRINEVLIRKIKEFLLQ